MSQLRSLLRLNRPLHLFLALLTYILGLGIARYLGANLRLQAQFLGGAIIILLLAASGLFVAGFRPFNEPIVQGETRAEREALRRLLLAFGVAFVAVAGVLFFLLQRAGFIHLDSGLLLALFAVLALCNALPPVRLANRGFGEIVDAFLIASLAPTLAFLLQTGNFHRLLTLVTFPLFLIFLACFLALGFPTYADDLKYERRSLLMALTWQQAVPIHNLLLIVAYLLLAAGPFFGISFRLLWPVLLSAPLAAYQIFALHNITAGAAPLWNVFKITAFAIIGLATYLLALAFWMG
jgi:1,4-dihydroxy-2-naphthoate octaprenyltransferase